MTTILYVVLFVLLAPFVALTVTKAIMRAYLATKKEFEQEKQNGENKKAKTVREEEGRDSQIWN